MLWLVSSIVMNLLLAANQNQGSARLMMDKIGDEGLVVDGRKLFFEYR